MPINKTSMQSLLFETAAHSQSGKTLFFADENAQPEELPSWFKDKQHLTISNRFDIYQDLKKLGYNSSFSDFDLSPEYDAGFQQVLIRISKEKLLNHYLIEQAYKALAPDGRLMIIGAKNEGIKSIQKFAEAIFQSSQKLKFKPQIELYHFIKTDEKVIADIELQARETYKALHNIACLDQALSELDFTSDLEIQSKPGVFGWKKLDEASLLLIETGLRYLKSHSADWLQGDFTLLDIGTGSGLLALAFSDKLKPAILQACDNNAAAIQCCQANLKVLKQALPDSRFEVIASDCANEVPNKADLIVCNPPFHQGFNVNSNLPDRFIESIKDHLNKQSLCLLVANQFVAYEKLAEKNHLNCQEITRKNGFKVLLLTMK